MGVHFGSGFIESCIMLSKQFRSTELGFHGFYKETFDYTENKMHYN